MAVFKVAEVENAALQCATLCVCGGNCYDIKPVRKEEGKFYWKIPLGDDDATREK